MARLVVSRCDQRAVLYIYIIIHMCNIYRQCGCVEICLSSCDHCFPHIAAGSEIMDDARYILCYVSTTHTRRHTQTHADTRRHTHRHTDTIPAPNTARTHTRTHARTRHCLLAHTRILKYAYMYVHIHIYICNIYIYIIHILGPSNNEAAVRNGRIGTFNHC